MLLLNQGFFLALRLLEKTEAPVRRDLQSRRSEY